MTHKASYAIILLLIALLVLIVSQTEIQHEQLMWVIAGGLLLVVVTLALNLYKIADLAEMEVTKTPRKSRQFNKFIRAAFIAMVISIIIFFYFFADIIVSL